MFNAAIANGAGVDLTAAEKIKLEDELLLSSLETDKTKFAEFFNEVENLGREVRRTCEYYLINKKGCKIYASGFGRRRCKYGRIVRIFERRYGNEGCR